jgi:formate hydrogenlyase subunit 6/NADH:ubiquinone oxidoreductase subunit I
MCIRDRDVLEMERCIRCGECLRACPTSALQPAMLEAGFQGHATPLLVPRLGYCDYACNACGQICPVQAIPPLSLEQKRLQVIGKAYIDQNRCIPWADQQTCLVCEEMCPIPEKAILLETQEVHNAQGERVSVQVPRVVRERCIGCGICEYKCPLNGEAAIRVFVPQTFIPF